MIIKRIFGTTWCVVLTVMTAIGISRVAGIDQWPVIAAGLLGAVYSTRFTGR